MLFKNGFHLDIIQRQIHPRQLPGQSGTAVIQHIAVVVQVQHFLVMGVIALGVFAQQIQHPGVVIAGERVAPALAVIGSLG